MPITKKLEDCVAPDDTKWLCVSLTAEETSRFLDKYKAKVQLRAQHAESGTVFGIKPKLVTVYPMSDDIPVKPNATYFFEIGCFSPYMHLSTFVTPQGSDYGSSTIHSLDGQVHNLERMLYPNSKMDITGGH